MKNNKIIYWLSTIFILLFEGLMPALTSQTEFAKEAIRNLGYPEYFGVALTIAKIAGALAITLPFISEKIKEWAYAGLAFELIFALISNLAVDGLNPQAFLPAVILLILMVSYLYRDKIKTAR
jgi:hypothetical protein